VSRTLRRLGRAPSVRAGTLGACALAALSLAGCVGLWDDVSARGWRPKDLFYSPDPVEVLSEKTDDNDKRAKALRALTEPRQRGGPEEEQKWALALLEQTATQDLNVICRLAAIEALGRFKDDRAVKALEEAYFKAVNFSPDMNTVISQKAIAALGDTGNPAAIGLLVRVAREPEADKKATTEERRQLSDIRLTALRSLGKFRQPEAADALVQVMHQSREVALRDRAYDSLKVVTGKRYSADSSEWNQYALGGPARPGSPRDPVAFPGPPQDTLARQPAQPELRPATFP
jgi:hypothetical protein